MQFLDHIMLDPVTDAAAKQDCPNNDRDFLHSLTVYNTSSAIAMQCNAKFVLLACVMQWEQRV